jgi:NAD(P)H-dependent FMN reductase
MRVLVIPGSVRPNSTNHTLIPYVEQELAAHSDVEFEVASLDDIRLPFYDAPMPPSAEGFEATDEKVKAWTEKVGAFDAYVFVAAEYNHSIAAIQKNAIDWVFKEWNGKKAAVVTYNWYDHKNAADALSKMLPIVKLSMVEPVAGLKFGVELAPDGTVIDESAVKAKIHDAISALVTA